MKSRLSVTLALIAATGGIAAVAWTASAQQPPAGAPIPPPAIERHAPPPHWTLSPADRAALLDARLAALHVGLKLTPDQEKLWPPVEAALRAAAKNAQERREKLQSESRPEDIIAFLRRLSEGATARGESFKAIADAGAPLYATLTEEQKHRLPILLHGVRPHFWGGHFGMMGHDMMGPGMMHEGPHGWRGGEEESGMSGPHDGDEDPHPWSD